MEILPMLAGIRDYMYFWQLPLFGLFLIGWLWGGGYLLMRSLRKHEQYRRIKLSQCVLNCFLGGIAGGITGAVFFRLFFTIGNVTETNLLIPSAVIALIFMAFASLLVIYAMLSLSLRDAVAAGALPVGAILILLIAVCTAAGIPAYFLRISKLERQNCRNNLALIAEGLRTHQRAFAKPASSLDVLVERNLIATTSIPCPAGAPDKHKSYFYHPASLVARDVSSEKILICDLKGNHPGGRNVVFVNGQELWYDEDGFRVLLNKEVNKDFSAGLPAAEGE
jgi:hypothetical protein